MDAQQTETDEQLIQRFADGDYAAFEALYARYRGASYRYLLRCGSPSQADDLHQELWSRVIRKRQQFCGVNFRAYFFRTARNLLADAQRQARREPRFDHEPEACAIREADHPDRISERQRLLERLLTRLNQLPVAQREAFVMREEGLSITEIAAATGSTAETIKSRLRYAVSKLKKGLSL